MKKILFLTGSLENGEESDNIVDRFATSRNTSHYEIVSRSLDRDISSWSDGRRLNFDIIVIKVAGLSDKDTLDLIQLLRRSCRKVFICIFNSAIVDKPMMRYQCFQSGASMVTDSLSSLQEVVDRIRSVGLRGGKYSCPYCNASGFTEDELWHHCPQYHINELNVKMKCPICDKRTKEPIQVHIRNAHGPAGRGEIHCEFDSKDTHIYWFALVVCRNPKDNRFLLVQEFANSGYWLPGGRIDAGENPLQAAIRETKEEAGIDINLTGFISIECSPALQSARTPYVRMRFIFTAEPKDCNQTPKSIPDYESAGATWCHVDEVGQLPLRGSEPSKWFRYVAAGNPIYPLSCINTKDVAKRSSTQISATIN